MFAKLFLLTTLLAIFSIGQAQWQIVTPSHMLVLQNDIYFQKGFELCKQKVEQAGKVYKNIMYIRIGTGFEYNLNDTNNDIHICRIARVAPPVYAIVTLYTLF